VEQVLKTMVTIPQPHELKMAEEEKDPDKEEKVKTEPSAKNPQYTTIMDPITVTVDVVS